MTQEAGAPGLERLTYGQKLIAEAIEAHFGEQPAVEEERPVDDDTTLFDVWGEFDRLSALSPAPAGGEVRALREALEPFADAMHGLSDRVADDAAILLTIDGRPVVTFAWVKAGDFRRARSVFTGHPADAAQAGEAEPLSVTEVMQRVSDHCNKHEGKTQAPFSIKGMRLLLAEIQHLRGVLKERSSPSREEVPTDEQVERAQSARIDYMTRNGQGYTSDAAMRAALKAAGPSAQQRVSEEMVERARKNLAASGIWVSAHGVMQVLEAALSPENGGA